MLERYPDRPGSRGIDTSDAAADQIAPVSGRLRKLVMSAVRNAGTRGITTNEIAWLHDIDRGSIQPRTSELRALGHIRDSGMRRRNENGKLAIVWAATGDAE
jgi:hypothetical protein